MPYIRTAFSANGWTFLLLFWLFWCSFRDFAVSWNAASFCHHGIDIARSLPLPTPYPWNVPSTRIGISMPERSRFLYASLNSRTIFTFAVSSGYSARSAVSIASSRLYSGASPFSRLDMTCLLFRYLDFLRVLSLTATGSRFFRTFFSGFICVMVESISIVYQQSQHVPISRSISFLFSRFSIRFFNIAFLSMEF